MKESLIVSACLLGVNCKYSGGSNKLPDGSIAALYEKYAIIPVCPECYGGLTTPRLPSERIGDRVIASDGTDVTAQYTAGAEAALLLSQQSGAKLALLKEYSPSCGRDRIYDGSFSLTLTDGTGVTAELLMKNGVSVFGETELNKLI